MDIPKTTPKKPELVVELRNRPAKSLKGIIDDLMKEFSETHTLKFIVRD